MRFKYGSATVTAKNSKSGAVITEVRFAIGNEKFSLSQLHFNERLDKLLKKLERKANIIFAKNSKSKKQQGVN